MNRNWVRTDCLVITWLASVTTPRGSKALPAPGRPDPVRHAGNGSGNTQFWLLVDQMLFGVEMNFEPDFQYVIRPIAQSNIHNAAVFGFRANVEF
jgi:hypothetical protein